MRKCIFRIIMVCFSLALLGGCFNSKKDEIVFERYDKATKEYVFYKQITNSNDISIIRGILKDLDYTDFYDVKQKKVPTYQFYFVNADRDDKAILWMLWIDDSENCFLSSDGFSSQMCLSKDDSRNLLTILSK